MTDPTATLAPARTTARPADRYQRGFELMDRIQGLEAGQKIRDGFAAISPDFGRYVIEAGFADVYDLPGLTLAQRQLINAAVLTALGGVENQLAVHVRGALNVGLSPSPPNRGTRPRRPDPCSLSPLPVSADPTSSPSPTSRHQNPAPDRSAST